MNGRSTTLVAVLVAIILGWLGYALFSGGNNVTIKVIQQTPDSDAYRSAIVLFGFDPALELTELLVERLDEATETQRGMVVVTSEGPGPVWRLIPREERVASDPARVIPYARRNCRINKDVGLVTDREIGAIHLEPGVRYRITVKTKGGLSGSTEFVAEPNRRATNRAS